MLKTISILILGACFYGPVLAAGNAAIGFATDTVAAVNQATAARCAAYNAVTPGTCTMP
jgi:sugar phosphate permease